MAIKFTPDQQNAIDARGTVLVSAAAGSGKTAVLTERVVKKICDVNDPASIDRLLIVTFTNASALEMRTRIEKRLEAEFEAHPNNAYILKQKLLLRNAKICTIDSFCIELVRKYFGQLNIDPNFSVADPSQTASLRDSALKTVLAAHYMNPDDDFNSLCSCFGIDKGERNLAEAILKVYDKSICMSRPKKWLKEISSAYNCDNINDTSFAKELYSYLQMKIGFACEMAALVLQMIKGTEFEAPYTEAFKETYNKLKDIQQAVNQSDWDGLFSLASKFEKTDIPTVKKPQDTYLRDTVKTMRDDIFSAVSSVGAKMLGTAEIAVAALRRSAPAVKALVGLVEEFYELYFENLKRNNMLTFAYVEQLALQVLCDEADGELKPSLLSKEICKQFDEVLVDEYQDNNDLQDALFFAVSDSGKHLFMVGDVKQSIYGFRNANPDNFLKHKNTFVPYDGASSPSKVILKSNFRSREGVCDFVNAFCNAVMQEKTCGMDYTEEEVLICGANYPKTDAIDVQICLNDASNCGEKSHADAINIAEYILNTLNEEPFLRDENGLRKAEFKDFVILLRSPAGRVNGYIKELRKRGIPVAYDSGEFYTSAEILTVMSLLRVIDNPSRDIPLISAMTSVAFGFTYDEVADIKYKFNGRNLYARVVLAAQNGNEKCAAMLKTISKFRASAVTLPVEQLISEIYRVTSLKEILSSADDGAQKKMNLIKLLGLAADYEAKFNGGLSGFIGFIDSNSDGGAGDKSLGDTNAVRIMSFHGSKGLQFPICIVAGCGNQFNDTDSKSSLIVNSKGIGIKYVDPVLSVRTDTVAHTAMAVLEHSKLISEEIRLMYVAMTRAEERLVLSLSSKTLKNDIAKAAASLDVKALNDGKISASTVVSCNGFGKMILMSALLQKDGYKLAEYAEIPPLDVEGNAAFKLQISVPIECDRAGVLENGLKQGETCAPNEQVAQLIKDRFAYVYPFEAECSIPSKLAVTELVHGDRNDYAFNARPQFMSKFGLTPAQRGTVAHKFMQYADYSAAESDLHNELERLVEWEFLTEEEATAIDTNALQLFFKSDIYNRIKKADKVMREYKFMVEYPYNDQSTIIQGIADCVFFEGDDMVILDFKTDVITDMAELGDRYRQQLEIYKKALEEIFKANIKECVIYSLHKGNEIRV